METTLGGERLGSGKKQKIHLKEYERSTHDIGYVWRSTMGAGTLVPFMSEVALPGDTFDIGLECDIKTHPTIGPLFGSYKVQIDVFQVPMRLYNARLHMNELGIGMKMSEIKIPQVELVGKKFEITNNTDNQHINPSCIFSYLNIRGIGANPIYNHDAVRREFNAIPWLAYWDIYKNYYANKQEEIGYVIHNDMDVFPFQIIQFEINGIAIPTYPTTQFDITLVEGVTLINIDFADLLGMEVDLERIVLYYGSTPTKITDIFNEFDWDYTNSRVTGKSMLTGTFAKNGYGINYKVDNKTNIEPRLVEFPLDNIDKMRKNILQRVYDTSTYVIKEDEPELTPYSLALKTKSTIGLDDTSLQYGQEGLAIKTYNSDLFNNWISTEWIDGENGINEVTSIDTSDGSFTIDELNLSKKIYDMLNRIAISGGSYDDWLDATYTHKRIRSAENPMYVGGLSKELIFQEVISNAESADQPLGTLAGRGVLSKKNKGGKIRVKSDEPCYIIGIISLTPRVDYSQGNKWDMNLKTIDDLHKPALDEIGFQDLITDQMAWFDSAVYNNDGGFIARSAGKQPAWINYMTNINQVRGNFAIETEQMFMVLNRRYEPELKGVNFGIRDLTTYIDPKKFNHIFSYTRRDAQNFWAQIGINITARRKMSAKIIPNL